MIAAQAASPAAESFPERARRRLRPMPPGLHERRADLRGDHALDPRWPGRPGRAAPRVAAVLVPVLDRPEGPTVLLTERAASLRQHSGQIAFPGGKMDPEDPDPLATALREADEEVGLDPGRVRPLGYLDAYLSGTNFFIVPAVGLVAPGPDLVLNRAEVASAFEVPLAFLMDETNHEVHARAWQDRVRAYYAMPFGTRYIWGVTAGILRNMFERVYGP